MQPRSSDYGAGAGAGVYIAHTTHSARWACTLYTYVAHSVPLGSLVGPWYTCNLGWRPMVYMGRRLGGQSSLRTPVSITANVGASQLNMSDASPTYSRYNSIVNLQ